MDLRRRSNVRALAMRSGQLSVVSCQCVSRVRIRAKCTTRHRLLLTPTSCHVLKLVESQHPTGSPFVGHPESVRSSATGSITIRPPSESASGHTLHRPSQSANALHSVDLGKFSRATPDRRHSTTSPCNLAELDRLPISDILPFAFGVIVPPFISQRAYDHPHHVTEMFCLSRQCTVIPRLLSKTRCRYPFMGLPSHCSVRRSWLHTVDSLLLLPLHSSDIRSLTPVHGRFRRRRY